MHLAKLTFLVQPILANYNSQPPRNVPGFLLISLRYTLPILKYTISFNVYE